MSSTGYAEKTWLAITERERDEVMLAHIAYVKTSNVIDSVVGETFQLAAQSPDYGELMQECALDINLRAVDVDRDVNYILDSFRRIHSSALFSRLDNLFIYKGGMCLVKIVLTEDDPSMPSTRQIGVSVRVEIDSLRLRLMALLNEKEHASSLSSSSNISFWVPFVLGASAATAAAALMILVSR